MDIFYRLESGQLGWEHRCEIEKATRGELLWSYFPGSVGMREGGSFWVTEFSSVPLLHFALSMTGICEVLLKAKTSDAEYVFTEVDESLQFRRQGALVAVTASFSDSVISCPVDSFKCAVKEFAGTVLEDLTSMYPALAHVDVGRELSKSACAL